jgi:hypothetical protein
MAARKRVMLNTVAGALASVASQSVLLTCPIKLTPEQEEIFRDVIAHRETASWDKHDLRIAGQLAKASQMIVTLMDAVLMEGYTKVNDRGTVVGNPKVALLNSLTATQMLLNKTLGLSAPQKGLAGPDQAKRNAADKVAREAIANAQDEDELI